MASSDSTAGYFRAVWFRTRHQHAHIAHLAAFRELDGVETLEVRHTRLGFLQRTSPFRPEFETRVVLHLAHRLTQVGEASAGGDPYRDMTFERFTVLHPDLGALMTRLQAEHAEVGDAAVSFRTREYEAAVLESLRRRLDALGHPLDYELDDGTPLPGKRLLGRGTGAAPWAHAVSVALRKSGLVEATEIRTRYQRLV